MMNRRGVVLALSTLLIWSCGDDGESKGDSQVVADSGADTVPKPDSGGDFAAGDVAVDTAATGFAATVQSILTSTCSSSNCHGGSAPKAGLDLTAGKAYAALVGVASMQCTTLNRVEAGAPDKSYLVQKVEGAGSCFQKNKMPIGGSLSAAQIAAIKAWITAGAAND